MVRHLLPMSLPECYPCPCHRHASAHPGESVTRIVFYPERVEQPTYPTFSGLIPRGNDRTQGAPKRRPWAVLSHPFGVKKGGNYRAWRIVAQRVPGTFSIPGTQPFP